MKKQKTDWVKDIVERIIIDAVQNVSVRRNGLDTWDNQAYDESVTFWTRKINKKFTTQREEIISEIIDLVKENRKGTFTDDGGNDCWYIEYLVKKLNPYDR